MSRTQKCYYLPLSFCVTFRIKRSHHSKRKPASVKETDRKRLPRPLLPFPPGAPPPEARFRETRVSVPTSQVVSWSPSEQAQLRAGRRLTYLCVGWLGSVFRRSSLYRLLFLLLLSLVHRIICRVPARLNSWQQRRYRGPECPLHPRGGLG